MKEEWMLVKDAPKYYISSYSRVLSHQNKNAKILKPKKLKSGYLSVTLCYQPNKKKHYLVHRLVLSHFNPIENMDDYEVNHKDENKENNHLENLEWSTPVDNRNYGNRNDKIRSFQNKKVQCVETGKIYDSCKIAAEETGTCRSSISNCLKGKRNIAGNCHWRLVDE